ncbi:MAG: hypothetical protein QW579_04345 [Desulfurococcaceae archaeon]
MVRALDLQSSLGVVATPLVYEFSAAASNTLLAHSSADSSVCSRHGL